MKYYEAKRLIDKSGILNPDRDIRYSINKVRWHNHFETAEHFLTKALMSFLCMKKGKIVFTEADCRNGRTVDVLQMNKKGEFVGYEVESIKNSKKDVEGVDIIEINLSKIPIEAVNGIKSLAKWLEGFIV